MAKLISVFEVDARHLLLQFIPNITGLKLQQFNTKYIRDTEVFKLLSVELNYVIEITINVEIFYPINKGKHLEKVLDGMKDYKKFLL